MKRMLTGMLVVLLVMQGGVALAESNLADVCRQKEEALLRQLEYARQYNNYGRIRGLERALENLRTWCTDGGLLNNAEDDIADKREDVREREAELAEAIAEGKGQDKITQRELKLEEAREELRLAIEKRDALLRAADEGAE